MVIQQADYPRCDTPAAAPRSDAPARSPAHRSARAAPRPARGHVPRSARHPRPQGKAPSSRTRPCWRPVWRPDPHRAAWRCGHRAGAWPAASARSARGRKRGSCVRSCAISGGVHRGGPPSGVDSRSGLRGGFQLDSGVQGIHPGVHQTSHCYCVVISGSGVDSTRGGLPKIRPCRWRNCALRPPAYVSARKGTIKQWVSGLFQSRSVTD